MRVTILAREFPPAIGGIGDHTDRMAFELTRRGADVTVVTSPGAAARDAFSVRDVVDRWDARGVETIVRAVRDSAPNVVVWQYNPFAIGRRGCAPFAGRLARALSSCAPLVVYFHELWFPWGRRGARGLAWAVCQRAQARGVLRAASRWIVTTEARERDLARRDPAKTIRIPVGTNVAPLPDVEDARARFVIPSGAFVVAHLGTAGSHRDFVPVFGALDRLAAHGVDARLVLAGNSGPADVPARLADRVVVTGPMSHEGLSAVLRASGVYLHADPAGASAGRRTALVAALAHGLPLVAYRGPDTAPQLGEALVAVERDADDLARALEHLASDPAERARRGAAARAVFDDYFSWERIGDALMGVMRESAR